MPSIKFASSLPFDFCKSAILHDSIPSHEQGLSSKSLPCSFSPSLTASASPPHRAKIRPKYDALSSTPSGSVVMSISRLSNNACNSSKVIATSTYGFTSSFCTSAFFAVQGPINTTLQGASFSFRYFAMVAIGERLCDTNGTRSLKFFSI